MKIIEDHVSMFRMEHPSFGKCPWNCLQFFSLKHCPLKQMQEYGSAWKSLTWEVIEVLNEINLWIF